MEALGKGAVTFLFTDIEGSSERWDRLQAVMTDAVAGHDQVLSEQVIRHGGHVVKSLGDGVMAVFADPVAAVKAAIDAQRDLGDHGWPDAVGTLQVRVGIHTGHSRPQDGTISDRAHARHSHRRHRLATGGRQIDGSRRGPGVDSGRLS